MSEDTKLIDALKNFGLDDSLGDSAPLSSYFKAHRVLETMGDSRLSYMHLIKLFAISKDKVCEMLEQNSKKFGVKNAQKYIQQFEEDLHAAYYGGGAVWVVRKKYLSELHVVCSTLGFQELRATSAQYLNEDGELVLNVSPFRAMMLTCSDFGEVGCPMKKEVDDNGPSAKALALCDACLKKKTEGGFSYQKRPQ